MAIGRSVFNTLILHAGVDSVAVFTQDFKQVFPDARPVKATVKEEAKLMEHPLESGAQTTDHRIILAVEIELSLVIQSDDFPNVYRQIRQFYLNSTLLTVQTKTGVYNNQIVSAMPHEEDPDTFDTITVALKLRQVQFAMSQFGKRAAKPSNNKKVDRGVQQPAPVGNSAGVELVDSAAGKITNGAKTLGNAMRSLF
jgi:hypothetical protein